jgi:hypothetical protein
MIKRIQDIMSVVIINQGDIFLIILGERKGNLTHILWLKILAESQA